MGTACGQPAEDRLRCSLLVDVFGYRIILQSELYDFALGDEIRAGGELSPTSTSSKYRLVIGQSFTEWIKPQGYGGKEANSARL